MARFSHWVITDLCQQKLLGYYTPLETSGKLLTSCGKIKIDASTLVNSQEPQSTYVKHFFIIFSHGQTWLDLENKLIRRLNNRIII